MNPVDPSPRSSLPEPVEGSVSPTEALAGLPLQGPRGLEQVRLSAIVGATLRAALDLALGDEAPRRPLAVAWDDGALDVACALPAAGDLAAAATLLETVEGSLGRTEEGRAWTLRVPVLGARALYLMLHQGTLALAVPWHSVLRVRLATRPALEAMARRAGSAVLPTFVSVPSGPGEKPAVLVAHGLRRAFLVADRLVWRMPAERVETGESASQPALTAVVRTQEGEIFWVAEAARLLREVDPQPVPAPPRTPPRAKLPSKADAEEPRASSPPAPKPLLVELRREDVEPLSPAAPEPPAPAQRRALIAEDSPIGRIFLQRLLELRGFRVEGIEKAGELSEMLARGPWAVVFADVELPDAARGEHLPAAEAACRAAGWPLVALVRDGADEALAREARVPRTLRKPFEQDHLRRLLDELGLGADR